MKRNKKKICASFELGDSYVARVSMERVDIETRSKNWKMCFGEGTPEYQKFAFWLVPQIFEGCEGREPALAEAEYMVQALYIITNWTIHDLDFLGMAHKAISDLMEKRSTENTISDKEDAEILAEQRVMHDPAPENIDAHIASQAPELKKQKNGRKRTTKS